MCTTALLAQDTLKAGPISEQQFLAYASQKGFVVQTVAEYQNDLRELAIGNRAIDELLSYKAQSEADSVSLAAMKNGIAQLQANNLALKNGAAVVAQDRESLRAKMRADEQLLKSKDQTIWKLNDRGTQWWSVGIGPCAYYDLKHKQVKPGLALGVFVTIKRF